MAAALSVSGVVDDSSDKALSGMSDFFVGCSGESPLLDELGFESVSTGLREAGAAVFLVVAAAAEGTGERRPSESPEERVATEPAGKTLAKVCS